MGQTSLFIYPYSQICNESHGDCSLSAHHLSLFLFIAPHTGATSNDFLPGVTITPNFSGNYSQENYTLLLTNFKTLYSDVNQSVISFSYALTVASARGLIFGVLAGLFLGIGIGAFLEGTKSKNKPT